MKHQRGFTLYAYLAVGLLIAGLAIALKVQSARLDAAQQKVVALEQQVAQWTAAARECSDATKKAEKDAQERAKKAATALKQAQADQAAHKKEADRLRSLIGAKTDSACPAGEAVRKVREGLVR